MSESTDSIKKQLWAKMHKKAYRDNFVAAQLATNTAAQVQTIRESQGLTQKELANRTGMTQARISLIENPSYDNINVKTLKRVASALDVGLMIRFVAFSQLAAWAATISQETLSVQQFSEDRLHVDPVVEIIHAQIPGKGLKNFSGTMVEDLAVAHQSNLSPYGAAQRSFVQVQPVLEPA